MIKILILAHNVVRRPRASGSAIRFIQALANVCRPAVPGQLNLPPSFLEPFRAPGVELIDTLRTGHSFPVIR